jgi:hypothetical protein
MCHALSGVGSPAPAEPGCEEEEGEGESLAAMGKKKGKKKAPVEDTNAQDAADEAAYWALIDGSGSPEPEPETEPEPAPEPEPKKSAGPSKAARKRAAKAAREKEEPRKTVLDAAALRKEEKEGGGSRTESETAALSAQLGALGKRVHEVPADGDCLYLAVAHQLSPIVFVQINWLTSQLTETRRHFMR